MKRIVFLMGVGLVCAFLGGCATARPKGHLSSYSEMKPQFQLDRVWVAPGVQFGQFNILSLEVVNKTGKDSPSDEAKTQFLVERLQDNLQNAIQKTGVFQKIRPGKSEAAQARLRVFLTSLHPGSHTLRFLFGGIIFSGVGAARVAMEGEMIDTSTGASVFRFFDARVGDDLFGFEESETLMMDDLRAVADTIASAIAANR